MTMNIYAIFDGEVFRPIGPVALQPGAECRLTVETPPSQPDPGPDDGEVYALTAIAAMAVDMGVTDLADRHHEYAHTVVRDDSVSPPLRLDPDGAR